MIDYLPDEIICNEIFCYLDDQDLISLWEIDWLRPHIIFVINKQQKARFVCSNEKDFFEVEVDDAGIFAILVTPFTDTEKRELVRGHFSGTNIGKSVDSLIELIYENKFYDQFESSLTSYCLWKTYG